MTYIHNKQIIFFYIIIFIFIIYYFSYQSINLNFIFGVCIASLFLYYAKYFYDLQINSSISNDISKLNSIYPSLNHVSPYNDVVDFLFSIQDLYSYNPLVFENMIDSLENFFELYHNHLSQHSLSSIIYQSLSDIKRNALNDLSELHTNMPSNIFLNNKIDLALSQLESILNSYLDIAYHSYQQILYKNGFDISVSDIYIGPSPKNVYDDILDPSFLSDNQLY